MGCYKSGRMLCLVVFVSVFPEEGPAFEWVDWVKQIIWPELGMRVWVEQNVEEGWIRSLLGCWSWDTGLLLPSGLWFSSLQAETEIGISAVSTSPVSLGLPQAESRLQNFSASTDLWVNLIRNLRSLEKFGEYSCHCYYNAYQFYYSTVTNTLSTVHSLENSV